MPIAFHKDLTASDINIKIKLSNQQDDISDYYDESRYNLIENSWLAVAGLAWTEKKD